MPVADLALSLATCCSGWARLAHMRGTSMFNIIKTVYADPKIISIGWGVSSGKTV